MHDAVMEEFGDDWHAAEETVGAGVTRDVAPDLYMSSGTTGDEIELEEAQSRPQIASITKA